MKNKKNSNNSSSNNNSNNKKSSNKENNVLKNNKNKNKKIPLIFLIITVIIYSIIFIYDFNMFKKALVQFKNLFIQIIPVLLFMIVFMIVFDYFFDKKKIIKFSNKLKGIKGFIFAGLLGVISSGPIYMWYPFLEELKNKGVKLSYLTIFLYNRAIKLQLIPIMLIVYDVNFIIILFTVIFLASFIQGIILEKIIKLTD